MSSFKALQKASEPLARLVLRLTTRATGCILLLAFWSNTWVFAQEQVVVTAKADRNIVTSGTNVTLTIAVAGQFEQLDEPQLPTMNAFQVVGQRRSSQFNMVDGVIKSVTTFSYRLRPTGPSGLYTIEPIVVLVDGSLHRTDPIVIEISEEADVRGEPESPNRHAESKNNTSDRNAIPAPEGLNGQDLFAVADVDSTSPVVGQQTIYRFRFYQATNLADQPQVEWPAFSGFWTESLKPNRTSEQMVAGRQYRVTEVRQALFPLSTGRVTIEPTKLIIPGDPLKQAVELESNAVEIDVQPLPNNASDRFYGAVGQFEIVANVDADRVRVNEPVTLVVHVMGSGNLTLVSDPTAELGSEMAAWRSYDPEITTDITQDGATIVGKKTFKRLLVPLELGELTIPAFQLDYYDPTIGEYGIVSTAPITLRVDHNDSGTEAGTGDGEKQGSAARSVNGHTRVTTWSLITDLTPVFKRHFYWLVCTLPLLAVLGAGLLRHRRRSKPEDQAIAQTLDAGSLARKGLAEARELAHHDEDAAYAAISRAINDFLGAALGRPSAGLTHDSIQQVLSSRGVSSRLIDRTLACLDWADTSRFSPAAPGRDVDELIDRTACVIDELELNLNPSDAL